jgi:thioredoxin reductase
LRRHLAMRTLSRSWDVVIVGAGPAGLSAALVLGRACRSVLLCDHGRPRNWASKALYGFLTRDGTDPAEFRKLARDELRKYRNVRPLNREVTGARRLPDGCFEVQTGGGRFHCRKLLIATGVQDQLPKIAEIEHYFGVSVFQCPYCDGWELRDAPVAVYGKRLRGLEIARALTAWTRDIALCTNGDTQLSRTARGTLRCNRIKLYEQRIARLDGQGGHLRAILFEDGSYLHRKALFFDTASNGQSTLAESLGCEFNRKGGIRCRQYEATSVQGVFVAGNIIKDVQLSIVAAAEGARAAFGINRTLTREDFDLRVRFPTPASSPRKHVARDPNSGGGGTIPNS